MVLSTKLSIFARKFQNLNKMGFFFRLFFSLLRWMLANAFIPILLPVAFVWGMEMLLDGTSDFRNIFMTLLGKGFYIFSSLTLACSLLEDYDVFQKTIKWYEVAAITTLMIAIGIMFYWMERREPGYFMRSFEVFKWMWVGLALLSSEIKLRMILNKMN